MSKVPTAGRAPAIRLVAPTAALTTGLMAPLAAGAPGDLDPTFGNVGRVSALPQLEGAAWAVDTTTDDGVLFVGDEYCDYYDYYCASTSFAARLDAGGGLVAAFATARLAETLVRDIRQQPDGRAVAVGSSLSSEQARLAVFRLRTDGSLDPDFAGGIVLLSDPGGGSQSGTSLSLDPDGRITVAGMRNDQLLVARFLPTGALDLGFGSGGYFTWGSGIDPGSPPQLIRLDAGGYRVVVGVAKDPGSSDPRYTCRVLGLTASGALDAAFGTGGVSGPVLVPAPVGDSCSSVAEQPGMGVVVGGTAAAAPQYGFVARLTPGGTLDGTFDASSLPTSMSRVTALAVGGGRSLAVAGQDQTGLSGALVVRLQADGHLDTVFGRNGVTPIDLETATDAWPAIHDLKVRSDGSIVVAGEHYGNGLARPFVARLVGDTGAAGPGVLGIKTASQTVTEADGIALLQVRRTGGRSGSVSVDYVAAGAGPRAATAGTDFTAVQGKLTWADGDDADKEIAVPILRDSGPVEHPEHLEVRLSNPTGGSGLGKYSSPIEIRGDAYPAGVLELSPASAVTESAPSVTVTVSRADYAAGAVSVLLTVTPGTAIAGRDYQAVPPVRLTWSDMDSETKFVTIPLVSDVRHEKTETLSVVISDPGGGALLGDRTSATITIYDDDPSSSGGGQAGSWFLLLSSLAAVARRLRRGGS